MTLQARHLPEKGEVWIGVADTGDGISPDKLGLLFQRFQQVDENLERRQVGAGSVFVFSLPIVKQA